MRRSANEGTVAFGTAARDAVAFHFPGVAFQDASVPGLFAAADFKRLGRRSAPAASGTTVAVATAGTTATVIAAIGAVPTTIATVATLTIATVAALTIATVAALMIAAIGVVAFPSVSITAIAAVPTPVAGAFGAAGR